MLAVPAIQMMTFDYYSTRSTFVAFPTRCGAACYRNVILCQSSACKAALIPAITLMVLFRALKSAITIFSSQNENERTGKLWAVKCLEWKVNATFCCHLKNIICQLEAERRQRSFCCSRDEKIYREESWRLHQKFLLRREAKKAQGLSRREISFGCSKMYRDENLHRRFNPPSVGATIIQSIMRWNILPRKAAHQTRWKAKIPRYSK